MKIEIKKTHGKSEATRRSISPSGSLVTFASIDSNATYTVPQAGLATWPSNTRYHWTNNAHCIGNGNGKVQASA